MSESIMRAGPIDQSRSEAHLHRALWLIKFLRAMGAPCLIRADCGGLVLRLRNPSSQRWRIRHGNSGQRDNASVLRVASVRARSSANRATGILDT